MEWLNLKMRPTQFGANKTYPGDPKQKTGRQRNLPSSPAVIKRDLLQWFKRKALQKKEPYTD